MKRVMTFPNKRIHEIGHDLAAFILELMPGDKDMSNWDDSRFLAVFDTWFDKFLRYAETNRLISYEEIWMLNENPNGLDDFIKQVAIEAVREVIIEKA
jgi:hypothetical protein